MYRCLINLFGRIWWCLFNEAFAREEGILETQVPLSALLDESLVGLVSMTEVLWGLIATHFIRHSVRVEEEI